MRKLVIPVCAAAAVAAAVMMAQSNKGKPAENHDLGYSDTPVLPGQKWKVHDVERPRPRIITPGAKPGDAPSDAIVLFDGKDLSKWHTRKKARQGGGETPPLWRMGNGYFETVGSSGDLVSNAKFGDAQFHIEWSAPTPPKGKSQLRGNSGILIMERYEIQVLDSYENPTYADGQAGSIYGQWPPFVNATRPPGEWQVYDIIFEAPKFDGTKVVKMANATVIHNGVVLHNKQDIIGPMAHRIVRKYEPHAAEESLALQDHGDPVRYRNIWVRPLRGYDNP